MFKLGPDSRANGIFRTRKKGDYVPTMGFWKAALLAVFRSPRVLSEVLEFRRFCGIDRVSLGAYKPAPGLEPRALGRQFLLFDIVEKEGMRGRRFAKANWFPSRI